MKTAVTVCATEPQAYALTVQVRRLQAAMLKEEPGHIIVVGDESKPVKDAIAAYNKLMKSWEVHHLRFQTDKNEHKRDGYTRQQQLWIGQMRTLAFSHALTLGVDLVWSLDSDVLPPVNAFDCMKYMLDFDCGYYSVATCPYPNLKWIGGRGTFRNQIAPDIYDDERNIPKELLDEREKLQKELKDLDPPSKEKEARAKEIFSKLDEIQKKVRECPPNGNVFALNSKGWRQRGWMEDAYPAIGRGAVVPVDWCGFGCNLMNRKAVSLCQFDGYDGGGTEDLYICWNRWWPSGVRICAIPHCLCDHVKPNPGYDGKNSQYVLLQAYHEPDGECVGHIRFRERPFYSMATGERFNESNVGRFTEKKVEAESDKKKA